MAGVIGGVPQIDFSTVGNLGDIYDEARQKAVLRNILAPLAETDDPAALSQASRRLIGAGLLQQGVNLATLAQKQQEYQLGLSGLRFGTDVLRGMPTPGD